MPKTRPPVNREQYAVAQKRIHDGVWRVDVATGRIWSTARGDWVGAVRKTRGRGGGYVYLATRSGVGKALYVLAHRVIWESVHGPIPDGMQVNHVNGIKHDNRLDNLELVTARGNVQHAYATGLRRPTTGEINGMAKLTADDVRQIRQLCVQRVGQHEIARRFGITQTSVSQIQRGKSWAHVPGGEEAAAMPPKGKLSKAETTEVLDLLAAGHSQAVIAAKFGISQSGVSWIKRNKKRGG